MNGEHSGVLHLFFFQLCLLCSSGSVRTSVCLQSRFVADGRLGREKDLRLLGSRKVKDPCVLFV